MSLAYLLYVRRNSDDIGDREVCWTCCVCRSTWNIFGAVLSLNAAPRCCARKINILDIQVIGVFLTRPLWQGLAMHWPDFFSPGCPRGWSTKRHLACCRVTTVMNLNVCWCWLLNFSISFNSFTSLLTLISNQLRCLCSMITWPSQPEIANWLRQVRCS